MPSMENARSKDVLAGIGLKVGYGKGDQGCCLVGPVDFTLVAGEVLGLVGPNGAGKSTLLRTLVGLQDPLAGTVFLQGEPLQQWSAVDRAKRLAVVFPRLDAPDAMTGEDFVALGRIPHTGWTGRLLARDHELVHHSLAVTGSSILASRFLGQMSDGERQRLGFARALAQEARLVVLDEPTAFLDVPHRVALFRSLREQARKHGLCVLVSTHEIEMAQRHVDRLWVLDGKGGAHMGPVADCQTALHFAFGDLG